MPQQTINIGAAPNDGTGDDLRTAGDKINDNFTELYAALVGLLELKGDTDASANPNYPAASKGDAYRVTVAGRIGGVAGIDVEPGDLYYALADNAGGDQAAVGASWSVLQANTTGGGTVASLDDIGDVNAPTPAAGDVLTWDDTPGEWVPQAPSGGGAFSIDDATDVDTATTPPADGDVLTWNDTDGEWQPSAPNGGGGEWTVVDTADASASSSLDLAVVAADYDEWKLEGFDIVCSAALELALRVGTGVGPTIDTGANYDWRGDWDYGTGGAGTSSRAYVSASSNIRLGTVGSGSSPSGKPASVVCYLDKLASGDSMRVRHGETDYDGAGGLTEMQFSGVYNPTTEITGLRIYTASTADGTTPSGNMTSGRWVLSGRNRP